MKRMKSEDFLMNVLGILAAAGLSLLLAVVIRALLREAHSDESESARRYRERYRRRRERGKEGREAEA